MYYKVGSKVGTAENLNIPILVTGTVSVGDSTVCSDRKLCTFVEAATEVNKITGEAKLTVGGNSEVIENVIVNSGNGETKTVTSYLVQKADGVSENFSLNMNGRSFTASLQLTVANLDIIVFTIPSQVSSAEVSIIT